MIVLPEIAAPPQVQAYRRDPTRSTAVRKQGRSVVNRRVFELNRNLRMSLQEHDLAGLMVKNLPESYRAWSEPIGSRLERSEKLIRAIVEHTLATPPDWLNLLIEGAVWRGVVQAGKDIQVDITNFDITEIGRFHSTIAGQEIRGISGETQRRVLRHVARALEMKHSPPELMREVRTTLEKITRSRLIMLVNTVIIQAVNAGKLSTYKANGVKKVGIDPEWNPAGFTRKMRNKDAHAHGMWRDEMVNVLTAGDDLVCEDCEDIAGDGPYDIDVAESLIPAHPNCRCSFTPAEDKRFAAKEESEWFTPRSKRGRDDEDDDDD
jgi:hypothetical protein